MNQDLNNLNQDNYNTQGNNGIPNNQPLNNHNSNQGMNINQQIINAQQQPVIQESIPQSTNNTFESGNVNNQNSNNKSSKKMSLGLIIGIAIISIIAIVIIILFLLGQKNNNINNGENTNAQTNITNKDNKKNIEDYTWKDLVVSVDGNLIYPGIKIKDFLEYGFEITSGNLDKEILSLHSIGVSFKYNGISISSPKVFNVHDETLTVKNIELSYIDLNDEIINNLEVKLPGGLLITENTTIDEIVNSIGKYTKEIVGDYLWELNNEGSTMTISFINNKLKHVNLQYTIGTIKRVTK